MAPPIAPIDRVAAEQALLKLTAQTAAEAWRSIRREVFLGALTLETDNALYSFVDGVFSGRAPALRGGGFGAWALTPTMRGGRLHGFLANRGGLWSLSPEWRAGSLGVLCGANDRFTLTSPTHSCTIERAERTPVQSVTRPPTVRRPRPPSMTRLARLPEY